MASRAVEYTDRWISVDGTGSVLAALRYDPDQPFEVVAHFGLVTNTWHFARDLLIDGLRGFAGHYGDVMVWPADAGWVHVALHGHDGTACLRVGRPRLERFVRDMLRVVPRGREVQPVPDDVSEAVALLEGSSDE